VINFKGINLNNNFTFDNLKQQYQAALNAGYKIITCNEFTSSFQNSNKKLIINRVDIDFSVRKAEKLGKMFNNLGIKASFFIRLHAPEYNPFSFENYRIIKHLINSGHEIGYHSEIVDQSAIWGESAEDCLSRDIDTINRIFNIKIKGIASHGGLTGLNNLDFWKNHKSRDFGLLYEAYDWFDDTFYVSDAEWTNWKCYNKGKIVAGDNRSLSEHLLENHKIIYLLIHPETYFDIHCYE